MLCEAQVSVTNAKRGTPKNVSEHLG